MQNRTFLVLLRPIFGEKMKTAPPKKLGADVVKYKSWFGLKKRFEFPILAEKSVSISVKNLFFGDHLFWAEKTLEFPILAEKSASISVKTFFFGDHLFLAEKAFEFPSFPRNSVSIFGQTVDSDSRTMKFGSRSFAVFSLFQPPPLFQILAARLIVPVQIS